MQYGTGKGKALFVALLSCGHQLAPVLTIPSAAVFCESSMGWQGVYCLSASVTVIAVFVFFLIYRDVGTKTKTGSTSDCEVIEEKVKTTQSRRPPYLAIFTTPAVWGLICTGVADALAYLIFYFYGPIYVNKVLHFEVKQTGIMAAVPYLISIISKIVVGLFVHKTKLKDSPKAVFITKVVMQAILTGNFVVLLTLGSDSPGAAEALIVAAVVLSGLHYFLILMASQIVAQQYTHIISSSMAAFDGVCGLLLPVFVSTLAPNHTAEEWSHVFYCVIAFLTITNILFMVLTRLRPADWTKEEQSPET
uniref:MFS domain-containing protein n=1 Tax=Steinernema glaseri TaxID=37863 RepID=A0A1I7YTX3_9BILA